jgi:hypothetical protein
MDEYRIDTNELWYYILYPLIVIASAGTLYGFEILIAQYIQYLAPSIDMNNNWIVHGLSSGILLGIVIVLIEILTRGKGLASGVVSGVASITKNLYTIFQFLGAIVLATVLYIVIANLNTYLYPPRQSTETKYEPVKESFVDGSNINQTLKNVQTVTQGLQKSLDTLSTATDDTCFVMKGIERRFLDNSTAPEGDDGTPPSPAEAKEMKAQKLPGAKKQWNQKKQDWSATHGQVSMIECFTDESLSELVAANQQLSDLLASAPVQRVVAQVKSLQISATFSQSYIDQLVAKLNGEEFDNPEDTITTSNKLIAKAKDVQASIRTILDSTQTLKKNYAAIDAKSNDPNTVNNIAEKRV